MGARFVSDGGHVMGDIAVTRALGDMQFSPFVANEPSIVTLERTGREVFAVIAVKKQKRRTTVFIVFDFEAKKIV
jgi:hypothetical protein